MLSNKLKQRFCKDEGINIQIYDEPIFRDRLRLMGKLDLYIDFEELIAERFNGNEEAFFAEYNNVKDKVITYIKESEAYKVLNSIDMNEISCHYDFKQSDVYKETNIGKVFLSIDMRKANFSSLIAFSRDFELEQEFYSSTYWDEFMSQFTDIRHFKYSKYIRQVVLGNCNPKRQVTYEKFIMGLLLSKMLDSGVITEEHVYSMCCDEIILHAENLNEDMISTITGIIQDFSLDLFGNAYNFKVVNFKLGKLTNTEAYVKGWLDFDGKEIIDLEPKCVNPYDAPAIYRLLNNEGPDDSDLLFSHDGRVAKYIEHKDIKVIWNKEETGNGTTDTNNNNS